MKSYKDIKEAFAHPNHKKLDANGNGKVDAHDFKLLRKKKHEASETPAQEKQEDCSMKEAVGGFASHYSKSEKDAEMAGDHKGEKEPTFRSKSPKRSGFSALDKFKSSQADPVKQACDIAKQNGGNMTGSINKIEKIKKGLSNHPKVQAALQLANESFELTESSWPAKGESMKTTATMTKNKDGSTTTAFPDGTWKIESKGYKAEKKPTNLVYTHAKSDVAYQNLVYKKGGMDNYHLNKEEVEELEELSKATLGSYVKKASDDKADFAFQQGQLAGNQTKNKVAIQTSIDKEKKRRAGVSKAVGKLTKEEVEELEELSKKTLGSYIKKSIVDAANKTRIAGDPSVKNVPGSGVDKRIDAGEKAVKRERNTEKAINKLTRESIELEEGNFEKNMDIIKSGKLPPHIQAILDKRGAKGNDAIMAKGRAEKLKSIKEMLDEARAKKEPMEIYHPSYSSAVQHAKAHAEKQGYEISDDDWHSNVTMGPGKPSGGKTTRHVIPLHKDGKLSKKGLAIQVHDRQTNNKPYELNSYIN